MQKQFAAIVIALIISASPAFAETIHIGVDGMVCAFCAKGIEKNFKKQPETEKVNVNLEDKLVTVVTKKDATIKDDKIKEIIKDAGYDVTNIHHQK